MKGFVKLPRRVLLDPDLSDGAKLLYAALMSYAGRDGVCYPGQERLARDLGVGPWAIRERMRELEARGLVEVQRRGHGQTSVYRCCGDGDTEAGASGLTEGKPSVLTEGLASVSSREELESEELDSLSSLSALAEGFLVRLGYARPSHAKRERTITILRKLHDEGYSLADLEAACERAVLRKARGPELIPHLIGEAPPERPLSPTVQAVREAEAREHDLWQARKARFEALPPDQQAALIRQAQNTSPLLAARPADHPLVRAKAMEIMDGKGDDHVSAVQSA